MGFVNYLQNLWNADLDFPGRYLITFMVFSLVFMLWGKFRFGFIAGLYMFFHVIFFTNRDIFEQSFAVSSSGTMASAASFIIIGALFIVLAIWSFFIDSD